jgi:predicted RecA/RadA family phage recombinase
MKNFVQPGDVLTIAAPRALNAGDFVLVGKIAGVATTDAANGADVEVATEGVFELPVAGLTAGAPVYWNATANALTATATGNTRVGVAVAASNGSTTRVKLDEFIS